MCNLPFATKVMMRVCRCLDDDQPDSSIIISILRMHLLTFVSLTDGLISPRSVPSDRTRSNSRVRFDLDSNVEFPHEQRRPGSDDRRSYSDSEETVTSSRRHDRKSRRRGRRPRDPASQLFNDKYDRPPRDGSDSEDTIELPRRFDEHGNRKSDSMGDELAERLQDLLSGRASAGSFFKSIASSLSQEGEREERRPSRRRRASD